MDDCRVDFYQVFQNGILLATVTGTDNTFLVTGLTSSTQYTFKVEACDRAGNCSQDGPSLIVITLTSQQASSALSKSE